MKMLDQEGYLRVLKNMAMEGELKRSNLRSVCWKLFLSILSEDKSKWSSESEKSRKLFTDLKHKYIIDPHNTQLSMDVALNNPLSQEEDSPWNKYFKDKEIKKIIDQDVVRTFPDVEFFKSTEVRDQMTSILFCYVKEHPEIGYRQGMHELLAPVLFVMFSEQREDIESDTTLSPELKVVMDPKYAEHDSFIIFTEIMEHVTPWYISEESQQIMMNVAKITAANRWSDPRSTTPFQKGENILTSALSKKVEKIQFVLLKKADKELFERLIQLDILPQVYGIRWIRLLFGREFPLPSVLEMWDAIFADSSSMSLVEYLCVAMLVLIRKKLLLCDNAAAMQLLMQYPWSSDDIASTTDINDLIQLALHFRKPEEYPLPGRARQLFLFSEHYKNPLPQAVHPSQPPQHHNMGHLQRDRSSKSSRFGLKKMLSKPGGGARKPHPQPHSSPRPYSYSTTGHQPHPPNSSILPQRPQTQQHSQTVVQHQPMQQHQQQHRHGGVTSVTPVRPHKKGTFSQVLGRPEFISDHPLKDTEEQELKTNPPQSATTGTGNVLKERVERLETMCKYCGDKMESYLSVLQDEVQDLELPADPMEKILIKLAELKQIRDLLQGKLPFAGVEWLDNSEDVTDEDKQTNDSNLLTQDKTFAKPLSGEEDTITTESSALTFDEKPSDNKVVNSDDSTTSFDVVSGHSTNREELMKALFEDNTSSNNTKQVTGQNSTQKNIFSDSQFDPDEWVDIPNDELM